MQLADGQGDCYIAGKSVAATFDFPNWQVDGGFILGIDDSVAGNPARLFLGDSGGNNLSYSSSTGILAVTGTITATSGNIGGFYIGANDLWGGNAAIGNIATTIVLGNLDGTTKIALGPTADSITVGGAAPGFIADGTGRFYGGDGANDYIKFDGTNVSMSMALANALTIKNGGDINLEAGGDIILAPSDANPALIKWSTVHNLGAASTTARGLCIWPTTPDQEYFWIGYDPVNNVYSRYSDIGFHASDHVIMESYSDAENYAYVWALGGSPQVLVTVEELNVLGTYKFANTYFAPIVGTINLGHSTWKWEQGWFNDYIIALGGIHVGSTANPGTGNLVVDGKASIGTTIVANEHFCSVSASGDKAGKFYRPTNTVGAYVVHIFSDVGGVSSLIWRVEADGDTISATGSYTGSDARIKTNIKTIENASDKILSLKGRTFDWKYSGKPGLKYGLISQEVELILPELVRDDGADAPKELQEQGIKTSKALNYMGVIPVLVEAFKEHHQENENQITQLDERLKLLEAV